MWEPEGKGGRLRAPVRGGHHSIFFFEDACCSAHAAPFHAPQVTAHAHARTHTTLHHRSLNVSLRPPAAPQGPNLGGKEGKSEGGSHSPSNNRSITESRSISVWESAIAGRLTEYAAGVE